MQSAIVREIQKIITFAAIGALIVFAVYFAESIGVINRSPKPQLIGLGIIAGTAYLVKRVFQMRSTVMTFALTGFILFGLLPWLWMTFHNWKFDRMMGQF